MRETKPFTSISGKNEWSIFYLIGSFTEYPSENALNHNFCLFSRP